VKELEDSLRKDLEVVGGGDRGEDCEGQRLGNAEGEQGVQKDAVGDRRAGRHCERRPEVQCRATNRKIGWMSGRSRKWLGTKAEMRGWMRE